MHEPKIIDTKLPLTWLLSTAGAIIMSMAWLARTLSKTAIALGILPLIVGFISDVLIPISRPALVGFFMPESLYGPRIY